MISGLKPYPAMKDAAVPWLGDVPAHWEVRGLKNWLRMNQFVLSERTDGDYTFSYLDIGSIGTGRLKAKPERIRFLSAPSRARRVVRKGDTIVSMVRTYLKAVWHAEESCDDLIASTGFAVLTPQPGTLPKFVSYVCQSDTFTNRVSAESVGIAYPAIAETRLATIDVSVPPLPEQTAIVRFLDHADRRIRRYIRAKQKLIALLEEQKQAIIHRAVTGLIDVRTGQPYPAYKPSGVEWLGDVPAHWERRAVWQLFQIGRGKVTSHEYIANHPGPFPLYSSQTENDGVMGYIDTFMFEGDFLTWTTDGAYAGTLFRRSGKFNCTNVCGTLFPKTQLDLDFMRMAIASETKRQVRLDINPKLMNNMMARIRVSVPPCDEQIRIAKDVQRVVRPSDSVSERTQLHIDLLREYRTRLIADVVTGKLDVREAAAALPEVDSLATDDELDEPLDADAESALDELDATAEEVEA